MRHETFPRPSRLILAFAAFSVASLSFELNQRSFAQTERLELAPPAQGGPPNPPDGFGPPPGFGGPGGARGPMGEERKILKDFDKDGDKQLNGDERQAAREFLKKNPVRGPGRGFRQGGGQQNGPDGGRPPGGGFGPPPGFGGNENQEPPKPGMRISPGDVQVVQSRDLYAVDTLRTLFLDFERDDWEKELEDFHGTDVEVPGNADGRRSEVPGSWCPFPRCILVHDGQGRTETFAQRVDRFHREESSDSKAIRR
jgi:hypothetical protein